MGKVKKLMFRFFSEPGTHQEVDDTAHTVLFVLVVDDAAVLQEALQ